MQRHAQDLFRGLVIAAFCIVLAACSTLGLNTATTAEDKIGAAQIAVSQVRRDAVALLDAKQISADDAENIQRQADTFAAGIPVARAMLKTNPQAAGSKAQALLVGLRGLDSYLQSRKASK